MQLEFDSSHTNNYGYYRCPTCQKTFYGGGTALHTKDCTTPGYGACLYVIGPKVVEAIQTWAREYGDDDPSPLTGVTLNDIRVQLPFITLTSL